MSDQPIQLNLESIPKNSDNPEINQQILTQRKKRRRRNLTGLKNTREVYDLPNYLVKAYASLIDQKPLIRGRRIRVTQK